MHYANGREAKVGDKIVGKDSCGDPISGTVVKAFPGNETCNLSIVPTNAPLYVATAKECLHVDDAFLRKGPAGP